MLHWIQWIQDSHCVVLLGPCNRYRFDKHRGMIMMMMMILKSTPLLNRFQLHSPIWNLHLYSSPNIVRVIKSKIMRWAGHVARMGEERGVYRVLVGKLEGRRPLGRPRRRWVDNIRMDLQEVGCGYIDWIGLAQDRDRWRTLVSAVMNLRVPWNAGNFLTSCKLVSFSRRNQHHGVSK